MYVWSSPLPHPLLVNYLSIILVFLYFPFQWRCYFVCIVVRGEVIFTSVMVLGTKARSRCLPAGSGRGTQNRSVSNVAMQTVYRLCRPGSWDQPTPPTAANNPYRCGLTAEAERAPHPRSEPPSCVSVDTTNTAAAPPPPLLPICHQEFGDKAQYEESGERAARGPQEGLAPNGGADRLAK